MDICKLIQNLTPENYSISQSPDRWIINFSSFTDLKINSYRDSIKKYEDLKIFTVISKKSGLKCDYITSFSQVDEFSLVIHCKALDKNIRHKYRILDNIDINFILNIENFGRVKYFV